MTQSATMECCSLVVPAGKEQPRVEKGRDFPKPPGETGKELRLESRPFHPVHVAKAPQEYICS